MRATADNEKCASALKSIERRYRAIQYTAAIEPIGYRHF